MKEARRIINDNRRREIMIYSMKEKCMKLLEANWKYEEARKTEVWQQVINWKWQKWRNSKKSNWSQKTIINNENEEKKLWLTGWREAASSRKKEEMKKIFGWQMAESRESPQRRKYNVKARLSNWKLTGERKPRKNTAEKLWKYSKAAGKRGKEEIQWSSGGVTAAAMASTMKAENQQSENQTMQRK